MRARLPSLAALCVGCALRHPSPAPAPRPPRPALPTVLPDATLPAREERLANGLRVLVGEAPSMDTVSLALVHRAGRPASASTRIWVQRAVGGRIDALATLPTGAPVLNPPELWEGEGAEAWVYAVHPSALGHAILGAARALRGATVNPRPAARAAAVPRAQEDDVCASIREDFRPDTTALVAVGPVTLEAVVAYAEHLLGPWRPASSVPSRAAIAAPPAAPDATPARLRLVPSPGRDESAVRIEFRCRAETERDQAAALAALTHLGFPMGSPLRRSLRTELGYVYGWTIGSPAVRAGAMEAWFEVEVERARVEPSLRAIRATLARLAAEGLDAAQLAAARHAAIAGWRRRALDRTLFTRSLVEAASEGRPAAAPPPRIDRLASLTPAEVHAFIARELGPERAFITVSGDPDAHPPASLAGLGFGDASVDSR